MIKRLVWTNRRRLLGVAVIFVALIASLAMLQTSKVAEAAVLYPHADLVGWWRFDEGTGTIAEDSSGYGNHGTVHDATWVNGLYGKALNFDGIDDYVAVSCDDLSSKDFTITLWVKTSSTAAQEIIGKYWKLQQNIRVYIFNSKLGMYVRDAEGDVAQIGNIGDISDNLWHHIALVWDDTSKTLTPFLDSVEKTSVTNINVDDVDDETKAFWIGRRNGYNDMPLDGEVDEVRIYDRGLSTAEIQENFQMEPDFSSRLLAKLPMGTTQVIVTLSWQGTGSISVTIEPPSETYTEDMVPVYQKTVYSSSSGDMLNIKRLAVSVTALSNDESWYILLEFDDVEDYKITVEVQT